MTKIHLDERITNLKNDGVSDPHYMSALITTWSNTPLLEYLEESVNNDEATGETLDNLKREINGLEDMTYLDMAVYISQLVQENEGIECMVDKKSKKLHLLCDLLDILSLPIMDEYRILVEKCIRSKKQKGGS